MPFGPCVLVIVARLAQRLSGLPDTLPEERDARTAVALALEQLQSPRFGCKEAPFMKDVHRSAARGDLISHLAQMASSVARLSRSTAMTVLGCCLVTLITTQGLCRPVEAASPTIAPGYSSEVIHVKLRDGTPVALPEMILPPDLSGTEPSITGLFRLPKEQLDRLRAGGGGRAGQALPDLSLWYEVTVPPDTDAAAFMEQLRRLAPVAIVEPAPLPAPPPTITPDFAEHQGYLDTAPGGIEACTAWMIPGGNGSGITIYDVEYSWNQTHEDLSKAHGLPLLLDAGDAAVDPFRNDNHGTAVLGELIADHNALGITGIAWGADIGLVPANTAKRGYNPAHAILLAVADGASGDVILIEQQIPVCGLPNYGPLEWLPSVFDAIQTAVANGFVVVEAAGNGAVDLDQSACGTAFTRDVRDSGAIIVGAGFPSGSLVDRQREAFSTYGSRVDLQGWGSSVVTTGYGGLYRHPDAPADPDFRYTALFSGTSSASSMVAGAAANLQGLALSWFGGPLTPVQLRALLVDTGSPQLGDPVQPIGPRPDLRQAMAWLGEGIPAVTHASSPGEAPQPRVSSSDGLTLVGPPEEVLLPATGGEPVASACRLARGLIH